MFLIKRPSFPDKKFIIEIDGKQEGTAKNLDEAFETIIRQWNLSE